MVLKRGPGSRKVGGASRKAKAAKPADKVGASKTQKALVFKSNRGSSGSTLAVGKTKSTDCVGHDNITAINSEALTELNKHLFENPCKILVVLRMAKNEAFFKGSAVPPKDWLHPTLIYFKAVPKSLFKEVLLEYSANKRLGWTSADLGKADKAKEFKGIQNIGTHDVISVALDDSRMGRKPAKLVLGGIAATGRADWCCVQAGIS